MVGEGGSSAKASANNGKKGVGDEVHLRQSDSEQDAF